MSGWNCTYCCNVVSLLKLDEDKCKHGYSFTCYQSGCRYWSWVECIIIILRRLQNHQKLSDLASQSSSCRILMKFRYTCLLCFQILCSPQVEQRYVFVFICRSPGISQSIGLILIFQYLQSPCFSLQIMNSPPIKTILCVN